MYALRMSKKGIALLAVMLMGLVLIGLTPFARAAEGNIDTDKQGSITIHKFANPANSDNPGDGTELNNGSKPSTKPVQGVVFTYAKVKDINLETNAGWDLAKKLKVSSDGQITGDGQKSYQTNSPKHMPATNSVGTAKADKLDLGVYLVQEKFAPKNVTTRSAPFLVTIPFPNEKGWLYDVHVYPKNTVFTDTDKPVKTVVNADDVHFPGDTIIWKITQKIPALAKNETLKSFEITDQLPKGVNQIKKSDVIVKVKNQANINQRLNPTVEVQNNLVTVKFESDNLTKLASGWTVNVIISAEVSALIEDSLVNQSITNINGRDFVSSNSPGEGGKEKPTETVFGQVFIKKVNNDKQALGGAKFQISPVKGKKCEEKSTSSRTITTSDNDGTASLMVAAGNYCVKEIEAPLGYEIDPFYKEGLVVKVTDRTGTALEVINLRANDGEGGMLPNLPLTGAAGVVILTVLGGMILAAGAGFVIIAMRRRNHQEQ
ncbi:SpaH/EbpB family LPXTG-anchored major pilin [Arcanobacterium hippocoleae]|uniref:SpaH/EbpB family LPXTG-anchored major pilin n=1 Tax=Arcanobacterium hippocoleae TaxID=149017 RepID=UPI00333EC0E8